MAILSIFQQSKVQVLASWLCHDYQGWMLHMMGYSSKLKSTFTRYEWTVARQAKGATIATLWIASTIPSFSVAKLPSLTHVYSAGMALVVGWPSCRARGALVQLPYLRHPASKTACIPAGMRRPQACIAFSNFASFVMSSFQLSWHHTQLPM